MQIKIKVCGMRDATNIKELIKLQPDFIGFIFAEKSPRFVGENFPVEIADLVPETIIRTGVFVNSSEEYITTKTGKYRLGAVQLHGKESPEFCLSIKATGVMVIKAFSVDENFDFAETEMYRGKVDYFLFDTKTPQYGGSGKKFNWDILKKYSDDTFFFLSGGIEYTDAQIIKDLAIKKIMAVDINSRFETVPAFKDIDKIMKFSNGLRK